jgi:hypothetical protein
MYSAAAGHSTLGIPKSVGQEFVASDKPGKLPWHVKKHADGGGVGLGGDDSFGRQHQQEGGLSSNQPDPWYTRQAAREMLMPGGFINSSVAGRTDRLPVAVAADSNVLPADTLSGMGQGHSFAGSRIMSEALKIGPYGTAFAPHIGGHGPPGGSPPHPPSAPAGALREIENYAHGGPVDERNIAHCLLAGGEFLIPKNNWTDGKYLYRGVLSVGNGDLEKGHAILREMVKRVRKFVMEFLRDAPEPKH